jgi:hypothetical protein
MLDMFDGLCQLIYLFAGSFWVLPLPLAVIYAQVANPNA